MRYQSRCCPSYVCVCVCLSVYVCLCECVWWCACRYVCTFLYARGYGNVNACGSKRLMSLVSSFITLHSRYWDRVLHIKPKFDDWVFLVCCLLRRSNLSLPTLVLQAGLLKAGTGGWGVGGGNNLLSPCWWSMQFTHWAISLAWHWPSWYNKQKSTKA